MLGKGGRSELTGTADKRDGRAVARAIRASKNAVFFSSGIDVAPATPVQSAKLGYQEIA
jgi:hypothetical protein